jgi:hypothetical protein
MIKGQVSWLKLVILVTWDVEVGRMVVQGQWGRGRALSETPSEQIAGRSDMQTPSQSKAGHGDCASHP